MLFLHETVATVYPVKLGYSEARRRIDSLLTNRHYAEALVTTVFTVEKTLRRTLRQIIVSAGFRSKDADKLVGSYRGFDAIKKQWGIFDPQNRSLVSLVGDTDWQVFKKSAEMRNKLVHGIQVFDLSLCEEQAKSTLAALDRLKTLLDQTYEYSGWSTAKSRKKSVLHTDPKVKK